MQDKNINIRQAYYNILNGNVKYNGIDVPIYNAFVPNTYPSFYILVQNQSSVGRETKSCQTREMTFQLLISTRLDDNSGWECDKITDEVLKLIYPDRNTKIDNTLSIDLVSDNMILDYDDGAKKQIVERVLTFRHIY